MANIPTPFRQRTKMELLSQSPDVLGSLEDLKIERHLMENGEIPYIEETELEKAIRLEEEEQNASSALFLGVSFLLGRRCNKNIPLGMEYLHKASARGLSSANEVLYRVYAGKFGQEYEDERLFFIFAKYSSVKRPDRNETDGAVATLVVANCYINGIGTKKSVQDAYLYLQDSIERGIQKTVIEQILTASYTNGEITPTEYSLLKESLLGEV